MPEEPFSLDENARGTDVRDLAEPIPVHAWFQLPTRLIRRSDAYAHRMTPDAVYVEAGTGSTQLSAWVWRAAVRHRATHPADSTG